MAYASTNRRVSIVALAIAVSAALPARAETTSSDGTLSDDAGMTEIIVTAQRRAESIQNVPLAISAFSDAALARQGIDDTGDFRYRVPNLQFTGDGFGNANLSIRGIGTTLIGATIDQGVGVHVNGVPLTSPRILETDFFDVDRVEVLRGPQGTLYGRNAPAGVLNIITSVPGKKLEGTAFAEYGNYDSRRLKGAINLPISEAVAVRVAGYYLKRDGFTFNEFDGGRIDGRNQWAIRGSLRLDLSDTTRVRLSVDHFEENSNRSRIGKLLCTTDTRPFPANQGCVASSAGFDVPANNGTLPGLLNGLIPTFATNGRVSLINPGTVRTATNPADLRRVRLDFNPSNRVRETVATLNLEQDIGDLTLVSATGYQTSSVLSFADYDQVANSSFVSLGATPTALAIFPGGRISVPTSLSGDTRIVDNLFSVDQFNRDLTQYSQELRLQSEFGGAWNFLVGAFYLNTNNDSDYSVFSSGFETGGRLIGLPPSYFFSSQTRPSKLESYAVFAEAYWKLTPDLKITLGGRYTHDTKSVSSRTLLFNGPNVPLVYQEGTWERVTGRLVVDYKTTLGGLTDETLLYGSVATGFKGGGFNTVSSNPAISPEFKPEDITSFEIGTKNSLFNRRVQFNLTGFHYRYRNLQVSSIVDNTAVNDNIDARITGAEIEFVAQPFDGFSVNSTLGYLDTTIGAAQIIDLRDVTGGNPAYVGFKNPNNGSNCAVLTSAPDLARGCAGTSAISGVPVELSGKRLQNSPRWTFNVGMQYAIPIGDLQLTPRLDYFTQSASFSRIFNDPADRMPGYDRLDLSLTLGPQDGPWTLRAYVKNLEDQQVIVGQALNDPTAGLSTQVFLADPRTFGFSAEFKF